MGFFSLSKLLWFVCAPSHLLVWLGIAAAVLLFTNCRRIGRHVFVAFVAVFVMIGVLPLGPLLLRSLENEYPRPPWPARVDGVLTLGGGLSTRILSSRGVPGADVSQVRLVSTYELARRYPDARIVFSGGSGELGRGEIREARAAEYIFAQMGLAPKRLTLEDRSRNTWENILYSQRLVRPRAGETWLLATSAMQMPRAMAVARRVGWKLVPWPTDYCTPRRGVVGFFDVPVNLMEVDSAVHEWIGVIAYRWSNKA